MERPTSLERFWEKVSPEPNTGCWLWTGGVTGSRATMLWHGGRPVMAHRFIWEAVHGPIRPGLTLKRNCENRLCVNVDHLCFFDTSRFWRRAKRVGSCWEWLGSCQRSGHGQCHYDGRPQKAHRIAWQLARGPIPPDVHVCHSCDNPPCINPAHLWLGTNADNMADRNKKGRQASGDRSGGAKLTAQEAQEIRDLVRSSGMTKAAIGLAYGVSAVHVFHLATGQRRGPHRLNS